MIITKMMTVAWITRFAQIGFLSEGENLPQGLRWRLTLDITLLTM